MSWNEYWFIFVLCCITMFICRVGPLVVLKGRKLPPPVCAALHLIPPAAFAALVANDLFTPGMFDGGVWPGCSIIVAALVVALVAIFSKSLVWSAITGVVVYGAILFFLV